MSPQVPPKSRLSIVVIRMVSLVTGGELPGRIRQYFQYGAIVELDRVLPMVSMRQYILAGGASVTLQRAERSASLAALAFATAGYAPVFLAGEVSMEILRGLRTRCGHEGSVRSVSVFVSESVLAREHGRRRRAALHTVFNPPDALTALRARSNVRGPDLQTSIASNQRISAARDRTDLYLDATDLDATAVTSWLGSRLR